MTLKPALAVLPAALLTTLLAACGGTPSPEKPGGYTPDLNFAFLRAAQAPDVLEPVEAQAIEVINAARARGITCTTAEGKATTYPPAGRLVMEGHLQRAAEWHARDMHERGYLDHFAPSPAPHGVQPIDRVMGAGYRPPKGLQNGENLASGYREADEVVRAWLASTKGHCETLAQAAYVDIGIANVGESWALEVATPL